MWLIRQAKLFSRILTWVLFGVSSFLLVSASVRFQQSSDVNALISFCSFYFILSILFASFAYGTAVIITLISLVSINLFISSLAMPQQMVFNLFFIIPFSIIMLILINIYKNRHKEIASAKSAKNSEFVESFNLLTLEYKKNISVKESFIKKMDRYWKFRKTAESLASLLSIAELCERIIQSTKEIIGKGEAYFLYLQQEDPNGKLELKNFEILTVAINPEDYTAPDEYLQWCQNNRQPLCVSDTDTDFRFAGQTRSPGAVKSLIIHPLFSSGQTIGFLRIDSLRKEYLNLEDLRVLSIISHLFSLLLQTVRLFLQTIELAIKDSLTGLFVRRYFEEEFEDLLARAKEQNQSFSVLLLDMDLLKKCNDEYGHMVGDILLQNTARKIKANSPLKAIVARYGGEEFAVVLPESTREEAAEVAEKIRRSIEEMELTIRRKPLKTTISIGIAQYPFDGTERDSLLKKADAALYRAKQGGRNQVILC